VGEMVPLESRLNITLSVGVEGDVMTKAGDLITGVAFGGELTLMDPVMEAALPRDPALTT